MPKVVGCGPMDEGAIDLVVRTTTRECVHQQEARAQMALASDDSKRSRDSVPTRFTCLYIFRCQLVMCG